MWSTEKLKLSLFSCLFWRTLPEVKFQYFIFVRWIEIEDLRVRSPLWAFVDPMRHMRGPGDSALGRRQFPPEPQMKNGRSQCNGVIYKHSSPQHLPKLSIKLTFCSRISVNCNSRHGILLWIYLPGLFISIPRRYFVAEMATMKGVLVDGKTQTLKDFPIPEPKEGQVLIKVVCAAQNPKDWKGTITLSSLSAEIMLTHCSSGIG